MLNFSYTFNREKRRSHDLKDNSRLHSGKYIFHQRFDPFERGYFCTNTEYFRNSEGSDTIKSDFRENSSSSAPDSPTYFNRSTNSANTSIVSQPVIDLNNVEKEVSKFKRSLSCPSQNTCNRGNAGELSLERDIHNYEPHHRKREYSFIHSGDFQDFSKTRYDLSAHDVIAMADKQKEKFDKSNNDKEDRSDLNIDEILISGQLAYDDEAGIKPRSGANIRILPEASEELLYRFQIRDASLVDVIQNKEDEEYEVKESDDELNIKKIRDRQLKKDRKKKTLISKTISKLRSGF